MLVIFLLTSTSFVINTSLIVICFQKMMAVHPFFPFVYICSSFQNIESNDSLFEYWLALITCWPNRMHQTWRNRNSESGSLKNFCLLCVSRLGYILLQPRCHVQVQGQARALWERAWVTVPINYWECKGRNLLDVQPSQAWWSRPGLPSSCSCTGSSDRLSQLRARTPQNS